MKKNWIFASLIALSVVLLATVQVMALPSNMPVTMPTPGAKATEMATMEGQGHVQGFGSSTHGKSANYKGTINTVSSTSLTLDLKDGSTITFVLDDNTIIKIPTFGRTTATTADLLPGSTVAVHAMDDGGVLTARIILLIPGKPTLIHRVGVVTAYTAGSSITIQASDGNSYTFVITGTTKLLPEDRASQLTVGSTVTIIAPRDVTGGPVTASGIIIHPAP